MSTVMKLETIKSKYYITIKTNFEVNVYIFVTWSCKSVLDQQRKI